LGILVNVVEACRPSKLKIILTSGYMFLILVSSVIPAHQGATRFRSFVDLDPGVQNLLHIPAYGVFSVLCLQVLSYSSMRTARKVVFVLAVSVVFGIINEMIQSMVPGRYASVPDIMLNLVGSILGVGLYVLAEHRRSGLLRRVVCGWSPRQDDYKRPL
jgi:VanZ family protein